MGAKARWVEVVLQRDGYAREAGRVAAVIYRGTCANSVFGGGRVFHALSG